LSAGGLEGSSELARHAERLLTALEAGGFRLECADGSGPELTVRRVGEGWFCSGDGSGAERLLRRGGPSEPGFVLLERPGGAEAGRTARLDGLGVAADLYYVLLGDGRLFRIGREDPREAGFDLTGWETEGAYLVARPGSGGWRLTPTPACGGIADITVLSILFAAVILEAERSLV